MPYVSQEQSLHGTNNPSTCREEAPHAYPAGYPLSNNSSAFGFNVFSTGEQDGRAEMQTWSSADQPSSFNDSRFPSQFSQFASQPNLYPPGSNIGLASPGPSTVSGGLSPQTFTESFSPQNNPVSLNYPQIQEFNNLHSMIPHWTLSSDRC